MVYDFQDISECLIFGQWRLIFRHFQRFQCFQFSVKTNAWFYIKVIVLYKYNIYIYYYYILYTPFILFIVCISLLKTENTENGCEARFYKRLNVLLETPKRFASNAEAF